MNAIVVDENGYKVEYVILEEINISDTFMYSKDLVPIGYTLGDKEILIQESVEVALSMLKPRWVENRWVEQATETELEELNNSDIIGMQKSNTEIKIEQLEEENIILMEGQVSLYERNLELEKQNIEIMEVLAEIFESTL